MTNSLTAIAAKSLPTVRRYRAFEAATTGLSLIGKHDSLEAAVLAIAGAPTGGAIPWHQLTLQPMGQPGDWSVSWRGQLLGTVQSV